MLPPILIADDDPAIRSLLRLIVERAGLDVDVASDGYEALTMIERRTYALVLLDLQMPRANGFDVVERLRTKEPRPVIIVVTALPRSQTVQLDTQRGSGDRPQTRRRLVPGGRHRGNRAFDGRVLSRSFAGWGHTSADTLTRLLDRTRV